MIFLISFWIATALFFCYMYGVPLSSEPRTSVQRWKKVMLIILIFSLILSIFSVGYTKYCRNYKLEKCLTESISNISLKRNSNEEYEYSYSDNGKTTYKVISADDCKIREGNTKKQCVKIYQYKFSKKAENSLVFKLFCFDYINDKFNITKNKYRYEFVVPEGYNIDLR